MKYSLATSNPSSLHLTYIVLLTIWMGQICRRKHDLPAGNSAWLFKVVQPQNYPHSMLPLSTSIMLDGLEQDVISISSTNLASVVSLQIRSEIWNELRKTVQPSPVAFPLNTLKICTAQ